MDLEYSTSSLIHCSGTWPTFVVLLQSFVGLNSSSSPQNEWKQLKMTANFPSVQILQSLFTFNYINCCCHSESNCDFKENSQKVYSHIRERICRRICLRQSQRPNLRFYWNNLKKLLQVITIDINNLRFNWNNHRKLIGIIVTRSMTSYSILPSPPKLALSSSFPRSSPRSSSTPSSPSLLPSSILAAENRYGISWEQRSFVEFLFLKYKSKMFHDNYGSGSINKKKPGSSFLSS